jgi:hypothetical protein
MNDMNMWVGCVFLIDSMYSLRFKSRLIESEPVTVAERSRTCTVFARLLARKPGSWIRIPLRAWMFSVCVCMCVFLCLCTGRGLATS